MIRLIGMITNNPMLLVWIALGAFAAGAVSGGGTAWTLQGWRLGAVQAKFDGFVSTTKALGEAAEAEKKRIDEANATTLKEIKNAIPKQIAAARSGAVRAYLAGLPAHPGSCPLPAPAVVSGGTDAASKEPIPCRPGFIEDAAQDAATIGLVQEWVRKVGLPIK